MKTCTLLINFIRVFNKKLVFSEKYIRDCILHYKSIVNIIRGFTNEINFSDKYTRDIT